MSFLLHASAFCYFVFGLVMAHQSVVVYRRKELGTWRSRILFPFSNTAPTDDLFRLTLVDLALAARLDDDPYGYGVLTGFIWPVRIAWALVWWTLVGLFQGIPAVFRRLRQVRFHSPRMPPKVRVDQKVSEDDLLEVKMEALEAAREHRRQLLIDLGMVEAQIAQREAELEQPQGDAFRGNIPAARGKARGRLGGGLCS